ncbi:MAG: hypothetical protein ACXWCU_19850, partial [Caldimonas sp.]
MAQRDAKTSLRRPPRATVGIVVAGAVLGAAALGLLFGADGVGRRALALIALAGAAALLASAFAMRVL